MAISQPSPLFGDLHKSTFVLGHLCLAVNGGVASEIAIVEVLYYLLELAIDFSSETRWS